jgi:ComF family protein
MDFLFPNTEGLNTFLNLDKDTLATHVHVQRDASHKLQSLFIYREVPIKASIQALKYKRNTEVARVYASLLATHILQTIDMYPATTWSIVPMPASKRRMEIHGFNQCKILCEAIMPLLDNRCVYNPHLFERIDNHTSQTKLARSERLQNVQHVFRIRETAEHDASFVQRDTAVMIIDDVYTTGATAYAAIETCRNAGFDTVVVWTLAH